MEYSDNVIEDVRDMKRDWTSSIDPFENEWTIDQVQYYMDLTDNFIKTAANMSDLVQFSVKLMRIGRNLDLTGSTETIPTIRHFIGTLNVAFNILSCGGKVHAIEGCDGSGQQIMGDIDLLATYGGSRVAIDYTNVHSPRKGIFVVSESSGRVVSSKYSKLRTMYPDCVPRVMCDGSVPQLDMKFSVTAFTDSPREDDFAAADDISHWIRRIKLTSAKSAVEAFANYILSERTDKRGMVVTASHLNCNYLHQIVSKNSPESAKYYLSFRDKASDHTKDKFLSGSFFDEWQDADVTTAFKFPLFARSSMTTDPFERLAEIKQRLESMLLDVHPFITALSELRHSQSVDFLMVNTTCHMERIIRDGDPFNAVKLTMPGMSWLLFREYMKSCTHKPKIHGDFVGLEEDYLRFDKDWMSAGNGGLDIDMLDSYLETIMPTGKFSNVVRKIMKGQLATVKSTKALSWVCQMQEIARALLSTPRKAKSIKMHKGDVHSSSIILSVDTVSDRLAVSISGLGPATFSSTSEWSYCIAGVPEPTEMSISVHQGLSRVVGMNMAGLDWFSTVLHRTISYYTLTTEYRVAQYGRSADLSKERSFPIMLMMQNNNKFAQASEMVRYIFVNGVGMSSSPKSLLEKISWYSPTTFTQKLYILRMCKMMDALQGFKSHNIIDELRLKQKSYVPTKEGGYMERVSESWDIAMPNESVPSKSDHAIFNSFYICRAMTIQRYNKMVSEALVLEKQLDSREEYLQVKSQNHQHELRFARIHNSVDDFLDDLADFRLSSTGPWSTNWRTQVLSIFSSALRLETRDLTKTIGAVFDSSYNLSDVLRTMEVSGVLNSRGSVRTCSKTGLVKTHTEGDQKHKVKITQNSKCWKTILEAVCMMNDGIKPPRADYYATADLETQEPPFDLTSLASSSDKLWPLVIWAAENHAICVSKMVHKDQIGSREIAVLNAWARVMCYFVESLARSVRDTEHTLGLKTNLIERHDKETFITNLLSRGSSHKAIGDKVLFDSADCSKWGPSMMPANLYLTLCCRMNSRTHRGILRNCLALFGTKLFKIPDHIYTKKTVVHTNSQSKVDIVMERLINMSRDIGSYDDQYIRLEESMHQGILGCTSSVFGSDVHNLSDTVLRMLYRDENLNVTTHLTSDDYSRMLTWSGDKGVYSMAKETLAIHNSILLSCGIKRNLQKSALSTHYLEFNSVYHTYSGDFRPDIKQRLSYVDYGHSLDPEPNAEESMTRAIEYLRLDGGLVGSCWIAALNNCLVLHQNQSIRLYNQIGDGIHHVPLELGGLIKVDPLLWCNATKFVSVIQNYSPTGNVQQAFNMMMSHMPDSATSVEAYIDEGHLKVASMSRSGIIHMSQRPKRSSRDIREFFMSQDRSFFNNILLNHEFNGMIMSLLACAHRELATESTEGSGLRLAACLHVSDVTLYRSNCPLYGTEVYSRNDLHKLALKFAAQEMDEPVQRVCPFDIKQIEAIISDHQFALDHWDMEELAWMPRKLHQEAVRKRFAPTFYVAETLDNFETEYNPLVNKTIEPWDFLECKEVLRQKLQKITVLRHNVHLALLEGDEIGTTLSQRILLSNAMGGCRMKLTGPSKLTPDKIWDSEMQVSLLALKECTHSKIGDRVRFGSPRYAALMRLGKVSVTDITGLLNLLSGDEAYSFTNDTLRNNLLSVLQSAMKREPGHFSVNVRLLTERFVSLEYASSRLHHIQQRALVSRDNQVVGREFITKMHNIWKHQCVLFSGNISLPSDTKTDRYEVTDLSECTYIDVSPHFDRGYFFVSTTSGVPLQLVNQTLFEQHSVYLWTRGSIESQLDELESEGVYDSTLVTKPEFREAFIESKGYFPTLDSEQSLIPSEPSEEDLDLGLDFEDALGDIMDLIESSPADDVVRTIAEDNPPAEELIDLGLDDDGNPVTLENLEYLRPLTESRLSKPEWVVMNMQTEATVLDITEESREEIDMDWRDHMYQIDIPVSLSCHNFKDDERGSAFKKLLDEVSTLEESESHWIRDMIITSFSNISVVRAAYQMRRAKIAGGRKSGGVKKSSSRFGGAKFN